MKVSSFCVVCRCFVICLVLVLLPFAVDPVDGAGAADTYDVAVVAGPLDGSGQGIRSLQKCPKRRSCLSKCALSKCGPGCAAKFRGKRRARCLESCSKNINCLERCKGVKRKAACLNPCKRGKEIRGQECRQQACTCQGDGDCRIIPNGCEANGRPCTCLGLPKAVPMPDPLCPRGCFTVRCVGAPCEGKSPACVQGKCRAV